jgi:hypothetical protein
MSIETGKASSDDTPKIQECLFIDLVPGEKFGVVAKVVEEPTEFPKGTVGAVKASREGKCFMRGWFQDGEAQCEEGLLGMPAIGSSFDPNQEEPIEITDQILLS